MSAGASEASGQIVHEGTAPSRPIRLVTAYDLRRSRLMVFFRVLLAMPHFFWFFLWSVIALPAALANWIATLVAGRSPAALPTLARSADRTG